MLRSSLYASGALLLCGAAFAQGDLSSMIQQTSGPIRDAGTYHLATQKWIRPHQHQTARAANPPKVLYANDCINATTVSYFGAAGQNGWTMVDDGRIPSTSSPNTQTDPFNHSYPGKADSVTVTAINILYVAGDPGPLRYKVAFYNQRGNECDDQRLVGTFAGGVIVDGLPGAPIAGSPVIWLLKIDWKGSTAEFDMDCDGDGIYDGTGDDDNFGWEHGIQRVDGNPITDPTGPVIAGDPLGRFGPACPWGAETYYGPPNLDGGTGLNTRDAFTLYNKPIVTGPIVPGCWWFGNYYGNPPAPYPSFWIRIKGENVASGPSIKELCNGSTGCPCANNNNGGLGVAGCANSAFATGARATAIGTFPTAMQIQGTNVQPSQFAISLRGSNKFEPGIPIFDGLLCVGGQTARSNAFFSNPAGLATSPILPQGPAGVQWNYQIWYRDTGLCAGSNLSNAVGITW